MGMSACLLTMILMIGWAYLEPIWISKATATVVDAFIEFVNFHFVCLTIESKLYKFDKSLFCFINQRVTVILISRIKIWIAFCIVISN